MVRVYDDTWTCCNCDGLNLIANAPSKCPVCSHAKCSSCTDSGNARCVPVCTTRVREAQNTSRLGWPLDEFLTLIPRPMSTGDPASHATLDNAVTRANFTVMKCDVHLAGCPELFARPPMRGWWYCHVSGNEHLNNPDLSPEACSECGHIKCSWCIVEE
ncbi:uncharacterized protein BDCG_04171 [Blastomyces dermatitidis ER-3]|uniref:Uncharacterized protein n=2 Tax=Ajellomyces dermatitidis TaxID=5039 RepID=F2TEH0_AJEDA|nr:uncharacterized protein BDCG_04171 [Blastomyces dermatitidis ER-3]EEQ89051.2 hypothetical protein BDCG_04171 [Blastomyces dermatitidis ER-3]EGE81633.2 hypothetical protein BDDG_04576 [Blastomyces dermatitidis ATCC 18188]